MAVRPEPLRALCLFDGFGGFELGLKLALGDRGVRTVARVERDSHAAAILVARMEEAALDHAPVWDDVCTFDGRPWRGRVDIVTAGFNCQPFSAAGQRRGVDDERWLWGDIARIVADVGPRYVFLENVPGLVRGGLSHIVGDLADLGFDAEWGLLSAADVGASHRRQRFWFLAWLDMGDADGSGRSEVAGSTFSDEGPDGWRQDAADVADGAGEDVADAEGIGQREQNDATCSVTWNDARSNARRGSISAWPPGPDDLAGWERWVADGGPEPQLRRDTDGRPIGLAESLHAGGNGLVPRVAAEAFAALAVRAGIGRIMR